jgi:hypothetical protein
MCLGLGICGALFWNARLGRSLPLLSLALFALNPYALRYADSIRPYGLGVLLMLITFNLLWRVAAAPGARNVALAALFSILSAHTLYQNAFLIAGMCAGGAVVCARRRQWRPLVLLAAVGGATAISLTAYLPTLARMSPIKVVHQVPLTWSMIREALFSTLQGGGGVAFLGWAVFPLAALGLAAGALIGRRKGIVPQQRDLLLYATTATVVGVGGFLLFLFVVHFMVRSWYCLLPLALVACMTDLVLAVLFQETRARLALAVVAAALAVCSALPVWKAIATRQTNLDSVAKYLETQASEHDLIVVMPWWCGPTVHRYYHGKASWTTLPALDDPGRQREDLVKEKMASVNPIAPALDAIKRTLQAGHRVWFIGGFAAPPEGKAPPYLAPAPDPRVGWHGAAYVKAWSMETGFLLQHHVSRAELVAVPANGPVSAFEDSPLVVVEGWRDN